ncbi:quercetin dioxygenase-like cupin family protein [Streptomyces sp. SAI-117]|nr:quercetin dioxygenase-like cupin family protein [Streptomyces sp. SAI-117]MDH6581545.1 quercetin dioxygenase-like cupin family protein [Streptomyces sp. SAI-133]
MKTLRVARDGRGCPRIESLSLPFVTPGPTATDADHELAPGPGSMSAVRQVRSAAVPPGPLETVSGDSARRLFLVVSGTLQVIVPDMRARLGAGDVLFLDVPGPLEAPVHIRAASRCSYLEVEVEPAWLPVGTVPPSLDEGRRTAYGSPRLLRLFSDGEVAHLSPFDDLFSAPAEKTQQVNALSFVSLSPSMSSDWHTEPGTSLLVVLAGGFEVEVGGNGGRRTLRAGDVCLVEDFEGQGHKSSSDGETRFAVLALPEGHLWRRDNRAEEATA